MSALPSKAIIRRRKLSAGTMALPPWRWNPLCPHSLKGEAALAHREFVFAMRPAGDAPREQRESGVERDARNRKEHQARKRRAGIDFGYS
jgi:hypothetical protein